MRRKVISELLDQDRGTPAEVAASLVDLRHINDWFGGTGATIALLQRIAAESNCRKLTLLEVASGAGDLPRAAQRALAGDGTELRVTLLDRVPSHLPRNDMASRRHDSREPCVDLVVFADILAAARVANHGDRSSFDSLCPERDCGL